MIEVESPGILREGNEDLTTVEAAILGASRGRKEGSKIGDNQGPVIIRIWTRASLETAGELLKGKARDIKADI